MKTTVGSQHTGGRAAVWPLTQSGEIIVAVHAPTGQFAAAALDKHSAHVLGTALINLAREAEKAEQETRDQIEKIRLGMVRS